MDDYVARISDNVASVRERIAAAAAQSSRRGDEIRMVAVTKYISPAAVGALVTAGCRLFGESRPQALWKKCEEIGDQSLEWHLIGHLQTNKVRRTLPLLSMIQSVDSMRLIDALDSEARSLTRSLTRPLAMLLEVNVSGDEAKHGFAPDEAQLVAAVERVSQSKSLVLKGLMAMSGRAADQDQTRRQFDRVRELRDALSKSVPASMQLNELSMGMSRDFELAIQSGATIVRVGSALFDGIDVDRRA